MINNVERDLRVIQFGYGFSEFLIAREVNKHFSMFGDKMDFKGCIMDKFALQMVLDTFMADGKKVDFDPDKIVFESLNNVTVNYSIYIDKNDNDVYLKELYLNSLGQVVGVLEVVRGTSKVIDTYKVVFDRVVINEE